MQNATKRGVKEGIGFGILAGLLFAGMEVVGALVMGNPPLMPFRMFASVLLGQEALEMIAGSTAFVIGSAVHISLSGLFGLVYGLFASRTSAQTQTGWGRQAGAGLLFGLALWFINFQIIARILYPWFLATPQFLQAMMHALFFGLPLGLMYAGAERRVHHVQRAAVR